MKNGSWEEFWYDGEPSPLENVVIQCKVCGDVMGFHEVDFRPMTQKDLLYMRQYEFCFIGVCRECWDEQQHAEEEPDEEEDE